MSLIHNERIKLTAACLNTLAAATITTRVVAPLVAIVFGFPATGTISRAGLGFACVAWLLLGVGLHFLARHVLKTRMTGFELYALFGSPLLLLLVALAIVWLTGLQDNNNRRQSPAE